jgi:nucleoside-diphosphate-sugar epimerase
LRVAVTGASGFVGSLLVPYLIKSGFEVLPLFRAKEGADVSNAQLVDYRNLAALKMQLIGVDVIIHLAGLAHQNEDAYSYDDYLQANQEITNILAEAAKSVDVKRFIFISSIAVNGDNTNARKPFSEIDDPNPSTFYGRSKLAAESSAIEVLKNSNTDFVIFRPPLIYGGSCPGNFRSLLHLCLRFRILPFQSFKNRRAMIFIENFMAAVVHSINQKNAANQIFIISDDEALTLGELINALMKEFHGSLCINMYFFVRILEFLARLTGKQGQWRKFSSNLEVDASKFRKMTNWRPPFNAYEGLSLTAQEFQNNA